VRNEYAMEKTAMLAFQLIGIALLALFFAAMISGTQDSAGH